MLRAEMGTRSPFKIGLFSPNLRGGIIPTTVSERWQATWDENLALAHAADAAGIDFILSGARWKGYDGAGDFQTVNLESTTWASAVLCATERITVLATVHAPFVHPVYAAMQFATVDQIGHGRFGVNIVCGWNEPEFAMFGIDQAEHDDRYAFGDEWLDVVRRIWMSEEPFDYHGDHFHLRGAIGRPAPFGGTNPLLINAGSSTAGRDFAARNCDYLFTVIVTLDRSEQELAEFRALAAEHGRMVGVLTPAYVVCRPTREEADSYHHRYAHDEADWPAVDRLMAQMGMTSESFPPDYYDTYRQRFAGGGGTYPIIGSPDDVAAELARIHAAGFDGVALGFVNYADELPFFLDEVMPRLEEMGVRAHRETA